MSGTDLSTLGSLDEHGYYLWAACVSNNDCHHVADLDMGVLIRKFGADFVFVGNDAVRSSLRCTKCGGKNIEIRIATAGKYSAESDRKQ